MKALRALLPCLVTLSGILSTPGDGAAADIQRSYRVFIHEGGKDTQVGAWTLDLFANLPDACRYSVTWSERAEPVDLYLDELKLRGRRSCSVNSSVGLMTTLSLAPDLPAIWRDATGEDTIVSLTLIEDASGVMKGVVHLRERGARALIVKP